MKTYRCSSLIFSLFSVYFSLLFLSSSFSNGQASINPWLPDHIIHNNITVYQEPAGCILPERALSMSPGERFDYGKSLLSPAAAIILSNPSPTAWNAVTVKRERLTPGTFAFLVPAGTPYYDVDSVRRAMHVSGFASWMRFIPGEGLELLLFSPTAVADPANVWTPYFQQYWQNPSRPAFDPYLIPISPQLPPCRWMTEMGLAPIDLSDQWSSQWSWSYPDYSRLATKYVASSTEEANQVAYRINWIENGDYESPSNMCGPLSWAILNDANSFPPGVGEWLRGPISFWLPDPKLTGRPWSLFPPDSYQKYKFSTPLNQFSFKDFPLYPGDLVYAYAKGDGDDHVFTIVDRDLGGRTYTISNFVKIQPSYQVTIRYSLLYDPQKPGAGVIQNEWSDLVNGRTGQNGFEVFRWKWLIKDLKGEEVKINIKPGDTILELAARWKTSPNLIMERNNININTSLQVGQTLSIPAQLLPDRFRLDLPISPVDNNISLTSRKTIQAK